MATYVKSVTTSVDFGHSGDEGFNLSRSHDLVLSHRLGRLWDTQDVQHSLNFSQTMKHLFAADLTQNLDITESLSGTQAQDPEDGQSISFSQSAVSAGSIFTRPESDTISFAQYCSAYIGGSLAECDGADLFDDNSNDFEISD